MNISDIALLRTKTQQISTKYFQDAEKVVHHMGALQAQDSAMNKWAIGLRCKGATEASIEKAFSDNRIVRTHLLRPTWHTVSACDVRWILSLTSPQIKPLLKSHLRNLGLTDELLQTSKAVIKNSFGKESFARHEINALLEAEGIRTQGQRSSMIMFYLEMEGVVCSGEVKNKQHTYSLMDDRIPMNALVTQEDQLKELAWRYFNSHAPATLEDFTWWSGLQITRARKALEMISDKLESVRIGQTLYWYPKSLEVSVPTGDAIYLLPAYDEYIISYKDRSAVIPLADFTRAINMNGIFWPVIVFNGKVIGTWSRAVKKDKVIVNPLAFKNFTIKQKRLIAKAAHEFGVFLGLKAEVAF